MTAIKVTILNDTPCKLGEGPAYDPATDTLWWFDILEKKLFAQVLGTGRVAVHNLPCMGSALAVVDGDRQLVATEKGLYLRDAGSGAMSLHKEIEPGKPGNRSNDSRVHPCGAFWVGTMAKDEARNAGAIYWYFRGEVRQLFPGIGIPNSICFSSDGTVAYYTDSWENIIWRVACDPETGLPSGEPKIFVDHRGMPGSCDGSVVDADGVLWNAVWGSSCVKAWSPDGKLLREIAVPALQASCPAFVGKAADRIAVTSAWKELSAADRAADVHAGKTFLIDLPVKGVPEPRVLF